MFILKMVKNCTEETLDMNEEGMKMYNFYLQFFPDFHEDINEEGDLHSNCSQLLLWTPFN